MNALRTLGVSGLASVLLLGGAAAPGAATTPHTAIGFQTIPVVRHDVSPPLRALPPVVGTDRQHRVLGPRFPGNGHGGGRKSGDGALQTSATTPLGARLGVGVAGVGAANYSINGIPPDTNGAAGDTQYVQWVNSAFAVFDKTTGSMVYGPADGNTLWTGFGGACEATNDGDPIAQYDKQAGRWVMSQLASTASPPYYYCVAVSTTSDATGTYARYAYSFGDNLPDYPKLGVWPDGYYFSVNAFWLGLIFQGAWACVLPRASMLSGGSGNGQCYLAGSGVASLLPGDLDGATAAPGSTGAPPAGAPGLFMNFGSNALNLFKYHVDWSDLSTSTWTGPLSVGVPSFAQACGGGSCIPQAGTSNVLASLADRLMYRLAYRNFGDHESLVVTHSTAGGGTAAVRWYELRDPNGALTLAQASSYGPNDGRYRWMGSVAMDKQGNIAAGYSESSGGMYPSIRITGRVAGTDPVNTLRQEVGVIDGTGAQIQYDRWGDYSAMTVDPVDDCTFWYTNEYLETTGVFNWSTRIQSFKLGTCD